MPNMLCNDKFNIDAFKGSRQASKGIKYTEKINLVKPAHYTESK